jgi:hypothetical protein
MIQAYYRSYLAGILTLTPGRINDISTMRTHNQSAMIRQLSHHTGANMTIIEQQHFMIPIVRMTAQSSIGTMGLLPKKAARHTLEQCKWNWRLES